MMGALCWFESGRIYLNWAIRTFLYCLLPVAVFCIPFYPFLVSEGKSSIQDFPGFLWVWYLSFFGLFAFLSYVAFKQALTGMYCIKTEEKAFRVEIQATNRDRKIIFLWTLMAVIMVVVKSVFFFVAMSKMMWFPLVLPTVYFIGWFVLSLILNFPYKSFSIKKVLLKDEPASTLKPVESE